MRVHRTQQKTQHQSELYRIVFSSVYVKSAILALFVAFLVQPIAPVFANEIAEAGAEASVEAEVAPEPEVPVVVEPQEELEEPVAETTKEVAGSSILSDSEKSETNEDKEVIESEVAEEVTQEAPSVEEPKASSTDGTVEDAVDEQVETGSKASSTETASEQASSTSDTSTDVGGAGSSAETTQDMSADGHGTTTEPVADTATSSLATTTDSVIRDEAPETETQPEVTEIIDETTEETETTSDPTADTTAEDPAALEVTATTTEEATPVDAMAYAINDTNRYQFGESECVSVGDGAFYCSSDSLGMNTAEDGVYAKVNEGGDKEIYYRKNGVETQITDNAYEDDAPHLDQMTDTIVFHRLIDGRYHIIVYDLVDETEKQLTSGRTNNMQPTKQGDVVVWQQWGVNNWEIAMFADGEITQLTDNQYQDVAPTVRDGYVMWHTTNSSGEKLLSVYEIETGISSTVADPDGGHVENPRFVLVYDTVYDNGDTITKEYDPETGEIRPIGSDPAPLPVNIPEPEPAGETRALIQTKSTSSKDELVEVSPGTGSSTPPTAVGTSTAAVGDDVVVDDGATLPTDLQATSTLDLSTSTEEVLPLTDFDVIVEPFSASSSAQEVDSTSATSSVE